MSVQDLKLGESGIIKNIRNSESSFTKRLLALGFTNGTEIKFINQAPSNDPILLELRNYSIAIRREDCENIILK